MYIILVFSQNSNEIYFNIIIINLDHANFFQNPNAEDNNSRS
jgi:hypothetical protein